MDCLVANWKGEWGMFSTYLINHRIKYYFPYKKGRVKYLVNFSKKNRYMYLEIPKVASSTIKYILYAIECDVDGLSLCENIHEKYKSAFCNVYEMGDDFHNLFKGNKYFRFSFVRNPFTRILSAYLDKIEKDSPAKEFFISRAGLYNKKITFRNFLESIKNIPDVDKDIHWAPQSFLLQKEKVDYHFIGRFENLNKSIDTLINKIATEKEKVSISDFSLDQHKTNASKKIDFYINRYERDLIIDIYRRDFELLCYSPDPHFALL